ncbi:MAG: arylsulfatase [Terriglobia bacterium]
MKHYTRRELFGTFGGAAASAGALARLAGAAPPRGPEAQGAKPNIIIILIDDQAYGDLSCTGNPKLRTPHIDRLSRDGVTFPNHYGCPLCSPARASLMTGRYNYRTGVVDTSTGLSMMRPNEVTMAQILRQAGYRTGIFSKWHLGDHCPLRPIDRGFEESLICRDAIVAGISNAPGNSLFNPILYHNEKPVRTQGYITDISFNAAMEFIEASRGQPFFVYLPTNVVHTPLQVAPRYSEPFKTMGFDDYTSTLYGEMVNLDENVGRLCAKLDELGLAKNTIIMYSVDNGPIGPNGVDVSPGTSGPGRYNAGLRGGKGTIYEGGIRLPFFVYWPRSLPAGRKSEQIVSHIDILPTVLDLCGLPAPSGVHMDGWSLRPLLQGASATWPERMLFSQQSRPDRPHRVYWDEPRPFVSCAARDQKYKIVMSAPNPDERYFKPVAFEETELYDLQNDPGETRNIAREHPEIVRSMRGEYEAWFRDVSRGIHPPVRNALGSTHENPVKLSAQDLRGVRSARGPHTLEAARVQAAKKQPLGFGYWAVDVARAGRYRITIQFELPRVLDAACPWRLPLKAGEAFLRIGDVEASQLIPGGATSVTFEVTVRPGKHFLNASLTGQREAGVEVSPFFVTCEYIESGESNS